MPYEGIFGALVSLGLPVRKELGSRRNLRAQSHGVNAKAVAKRRAASKQADKMRRRQRAK